MGSLGDFVNPHGMLTRHIPATFAATEKYPTGNLEGDLRFLPTLNAAVWRGRSDDGIHFFKRFEKSWRISVRTFWPVDKGVVNSRCSNVGAQDDAALTSHQKTGPPGLL